MNKFTLYLLLIFQVLLLLLLCTGGLLVYIIVTAMLLGFVGEHEFQPIYISNILYWIFISTIYGGMIFFNVTSIIAAVKLIKNKPLSIFNKISFVMFTLTAVFISWMVLQLF